MRTRSLALVALAYVAAIGVAAAWLVWGPHTGRLWCDTLIADVLATGVVFVFSRSFRNSSFYDAYWSVVPPLLLAYWWWQGPIGTHGPGALRCWLMAVAVGYWAIRLTGNWTYAMFLGASIPMMEERSLERRPDYQRVIDSVPRLVPRPPRTASR